MNTELYSVRPERAVLMEAPLTAISEGKATATKTLLRKLKALERRERAIERGPCSP